MRIAAVTTFSSLFMCVCLGVVCLPLVLCMCVCVLACSRCVYVMGCGPVW